MRVEGGGEWERGREGEREEREKEVEGERGGEERRGDYHTFKQFYHPQCHEHHQHNSSGIKSGYIMK